MPHEVKAMLKQSISNAYDNCVQLDLFEAARICVRHCFGFLSLRHHSIIVIGVYVSALPSNHARSINYSTFRHSFQTKITAYSPAGVFSGKKASAASDNGYQYFLHKLSLLRRSFPAGYSMIQLTKCFKGQIAHKGSGAPAAERSLPPAPEPF